MLYMMYVFTLTKMSDIMLFFAQEFTLAYIEPGQKNDKRIIFYPLIPRCIVAQQPQKWLYDLFSMLQDLYTDYHVNFVQII